MIQLLPCSKCEKALVLRNDVSETAKIACPHCEQEFVLKELLEDQFGYWKVVNDPDAEFRLAPEKPDFREVSLRHSVPMPVPTSPRAEPKVEDDEELRISEPVKRPKRKKEFTHVEPITYEQFERMKRKARSPIWSVVQIVLGGLAAIPLALILLWHLVGKDVAGAGPAVAKYAPWIVPEKFHPPTEDDDESPDVASHESDPEPGASGFKQFNESELRGEPSSSGSESGDAGLVDQGTPSSMDLAGAASEGSGVQTTTGVDPASDAAEISTGGSLVALGRQEMIAQSKQAGGETASRQNASPPEAGQEENAANPSSTNNGATNGKKRDVFAKIQDCQEGLADWRRSDTGVRQELASAAYGELVGLVDELAKLPPGSPLFRVVRDKMQPIGKSVKQHDELKDLVAQGSNQWLEERVDAEDLSIAVVVEIEQVEEGEEFWTVVPVGEELGFTLEAVRIPRNLAPSLIEGQKLLVLGKLGAAKSAPQKQGLTAYYIYAL